MFMETFVHSLLGKLAKAKKAGVVELNRWVAAKYQELGVRAGDRIPRLNPSDIFTDDFPCLRHVKGRRVRKFAPSGHSAGKRATNH